MIETTDTDIRINKEEMSVVEIIHTLRRDNIVIIVKEVIRKEVEVDKNLTN